MLSSRKPEKKRLSLSSFLDNRSTSCPRCWQIILSTQNICLCSLIRMSGLKHLRHEISHPIKNLTPQQGEDLSGRMVLKRTSGLKHRSEKWTEMKQKQSTHWLETLVTLGGGVRAELRLGWFTCCSVLVSPAADVLQWRRHTHQKLKDRETQAATQRQSA